MASSIVKEWQPLSILKMFIVQTMHSRSFGGKMKNIWTGMVGFLFLFLFLTGGVASAILCRRLRRPPLPTLAFAASSSTI